MGNEISTASRMLNAELIAKLSLSAFTSQPMKIQQQLLKSKSEVAMTRGDYFAHPLMKVWSAMHEVEDCNAHSSK